jgi:hypothetical protein
MTFSYMISAAWQSLFTPRAVAEQLLSAGFTRQAVLLGGAVVLILGAIFGTLTMALGPAPGGEDVAAISAFGLLILQVGGLFLTTFAAYGVGRLFGGEGSLDDVLLVVVWLNAVLLLLQLAQFAAALLAPGLADIIFIASFVLTVWLFVNFIAAAHRFTSVGKVFFGTLGALFAFSIVLTLLLPLFGIQIGAV